MTACLTCGKPLPDLAIKNHDPFCSRKHAEQHHGVRMAADLPSGTGRQSASMVSLKPSPGGPLPARTVLQREAEARSLAAHARLARERVERRARERKTRMAGWPE